MPCHMLLRKKCAGDRMIGAGRPGADVEVVSKAVAAILCKTRDFVKLLSRRRI